MGGKWEWNHGMGEKLRKKSIFLINVCYFFVNVSLSRSILVLEVCNQQSANSPCILYLMPLPLFTALVTHPRLEQQAPIAGGARKKGP